MNPACPSEEKLKLLICEAFDDITPIDHARITQIGSRLAQRSSNQATPKRARQWLFWLLVGATATASAFWLVANNQTNIVAPADKQVLPTPQSSTAQPPRTAEIGTSQNEKQKPASQNKDTRQGPIIYQREDY